MQSCAKIFDVLQQQCSAFLFMLIERIARFLSDIKRQRKAKQFQAKMPINVEEEAKWSENVKILRKTNKIGKFLLLGCREKKIGDILS